MVHKTPSQPAHFVAKRKLNPKELLSLVPSRARGQCSWSGSAASAAVWSPMSNEVDGEEGDEREKGGKKLAASVDLIQFSSFPQGLICEQPGGELRGQQTAP